MSRREARKRELMIGKKKTGNRFLRNQIANMLNTLEVFEKSCTLAAEMDDGKVDRNEAAVLEKLHKATVRYRKALSSIEFEESEP